jgi:hypothetical protein
MARTVSVAQARNPIGKEYHRLTQRGVMTNTPPEAGPNRPEEEMSEDRAEAAPTEAAAPATETAPTEESASTEEALSSEESVSEEETAPVEEQTQPQSKITPIRVAIAVAAVAAAWQTFGLARELLTEPRIAFEAHETIQSLDKAVAEAGLEEIIVPLTEGDGKLDIIYAGAPGCPHCQDFVSGEFEHYPEGAVPAPTSFADMLTQAREKGLDVAYMPLAMNSIDAVIASGEACAAPSDSVSAADRVQVSYGLVGPLNTAAETAREMIGEKAEPEAIRAVLTEALDAMNEKFSPGSEFDSECYEERVKSYGEAVSGFHQVFGRHGTPSFYFHEDNGQVSRFSGSGGVAAMLRQAAE